MNTLSHTSQVRPPEETAAMYINGTILRETESGPINAQALATKILEDAKYVSDEVRRHIEKYLEGVIHVAQDAQVERLPEKTAGQFDGAKKTIAAETLRVKDSIQKTLDHIEEVADHETYHEENEHMEEMEAVPGKEGDTVVTIGGKDFSERALVEGLTVERTGEEFVSDEYRQFRTDLTSATATAGVTLEEVETAVNEEKNLEVIDDSYREIAERAEASEQQHALVA